MNTIRAGLLFLATLVAAPLLAESIESKSPKLVVERPNASGPPTEVSIGVYLMDIDEIDDVNQLFSVDVYFDITWQDQRLALPENERLGQIRRMLLEDIWTPRLLVANDRGLKPQLPWDAEVDDLGNVHARQRAIGSLSADLSFEDFPFDTQQLPINIISHEYSPRDLKFSLNGNLSGDDGSFSAEGWRFRILGASYDGLQLPANEATWSRLIYSIEAERNSQYYLLTTFLPVSLIVFMSWLVFWLPPDIIPSRVGISTASIFSLIAFTLSIRMSLPRVSYVTHADMFLMGCTVLVFLALATVVVASRWVKVNREQDALRLNAVARWLYAGIFVLFAIWSFLI